MLVIKVMEVRPGAQESTLVHEVQIPSIHAPAFKAAISEIRDELAERVTGSYRTKREEALTRALSAVSAFAAALHKVVRREDSDYGRN